MIQNIEKFIGWPTQQSEIVLSGLLNIDKLIAQYTLSVNHGKDELDSYMAVFFKVDGIGPVAVILHDNNPQKHCLIYVDISVATKDAEDILLEILPFDNVVTIWRSSSSID